MSASTTGWAALPERYEPPRQTVHMFDIGPGLRRQVPGRAHFELEGQPLTLEPVIEEDSRRLYFVFADQGSDVVEVVDVDVACLGADD